MSKKFVARSVDLLPPSGIRKFFDIVSQMEDVISLGVGEPDFATPWKIREAAIYSIEHGYTTYTSNRGLPELREEIARYLTRRHGLLYDPAQEILVTVGVSQAIDLALRAVLSPGDEVIVPQPSFVSYGPLATLAGGIVVNVELKEESRFVLQPEELESCLTDRTKVLFLSYPNNPTGAIITRQEMEPLAELIKRHDLLLITDEVYSELTYEGKHVSFAELPGMRERTILLNGFSKAFSMTGWRIGYAAGPADIIGAMVKIAQYATMCPPIMGQYAAIEGLRSAEADVEAMVKEYNRRRKLMLNGFRDMGLKCFEPRGAFYIFPSIKSTGLTSEEFAEGLLREYQVAVVPGSAFGSAGEGFIRCSYASSVTALSEALRRIEEFVNKERRAGNRAISGA